jgi:hypothetical protein
MEHRDSLAGRAGLGLMGHRDSRAGRAGLELMGHRDSLAGRDGAGSVLADSRDGRAGRE